MKKIIILLATAALAVLSTGCSQEPRPAPKTIELGGTSYAPGADYPIQPKPFSEVTLEDDFWKPKIERNAAVTIPHVLERTKSGNALQAALYALRTRPDPGLQAQVDSRVREIVAAQAEKPAAGNGLFELAADYYKVTGKRDLLDIAVRSADAIYRIQQAEHPPFSGGERDAVNCIQLFRATGDKKHLDLAKYYLDIRGLENSTNRSRHNQSHQPVLEQTEAVGHAVNDATLMLSLADVGALTGIREYADAAERLWRDTVGTKLYVTGGIGSTGNEGFGKPYALPNLSSYCETCAGIMFAAFNHRMFLATGDSKYIDVLERAIYNNVVDGVSVTGNRFFYVNRLASAGDGRDLRWEWASLPCCPPNLVRFLASMPMYIYAQNKDGIYVNLYVSGKASFRVEDKDLALAVRSEMPWGGASEIVVSAADGVQGSIRLRIPGWARNRPVPGDIYAYLDKDEGRTRISVNGADSGQEVDPSGYVSLNRTWKDGDVIRIEFPFNVRKVVAHPNVRDDHGRMAVERGPIVYCAEGHDCEGGHALGLLWKADSELKPSFDESLLGGVHVITGEARNISRPSAEPKPVKLIPYHLWANRGAAEMSVWQSTAEYAPGDVGPAGGLVFYVNPNSEADGWRYLEAAPCDQSAGAPWGCFRASVPGADGAAVGTGMKNTLDMLAACPDPGSAAALCANYSLHGFDDWFLPSIDELTQMYLNLKVQGLGDFEAAGVADNFNYWSSTQATTDMARHLDFADNGLRRHYDDKDFPRRVRAIRAF